MNWGVWLGSAALLFAGVFLVRYAVEQELLGPAARCGFAALLGVALLAGAEFLHRHEGPALPGPFRIDQAPSGLAAGGTAFLFGAAYGAGTVLRIAAAAVEFRGDGGCVADRSGGGAAVRAAGGGDRDRGGVRHPCPGGDAEPVFAGVVRLPVPGLRRRAAWWCGARPGPGSVGRRPSAAACGCASPGCRRRRTAGPPRCSCPPPRR